MFSIRKTLVFVNTKYHFLVSIISILALINYFVGFLFFDNSSEFILYFIIIIGGLPLLSQIFFKLLKLNIGADLIAFIALILAIYLQENVTAVLIILMISSGQALEEYASHKACFVLESLEKRIPKLAHLQIENNYHDIAISDIKINDKIAIFPHEICPVDGEIIQGNGHMDESYLTGEPYKISKTIGSKVLSGAINGESLFIIRAEKIANDSRFEQIIKVMKKANEDKPNSRKIADKIGAIFAPITLIIAGLSFYFTSNLTNFLAVLTIATPCPLLIAVPIAIISAISISARQGIVIKDARILEKLSVCTTAIFDKTGTLTYGEPSLSEIICLDKKYNSTDIVQKTASLERYSRHPLAIAILNYAKNQNLILQDAKNMSEKPGFGIIGEINDDEVIITSRKRIHEFMAPDYEFPTDDYGMECVVVVNKKIIGLLRFFDLERKESHSFVNHLIPNHNFKKIILLSGDKSSEVEIIANRLGIQNYFSSKSPEEKLEIVRKETAKAKTLFMGDGINDAPALMLASVGIAFGNNNDISTESAGAVILKSDLFKVDELLHISSLTRKIILQSAVGGMIFSVIGMMFASAGYISPAYGAVLQQIIDFVAIINALRLTIAKNIHSDLIEENLTK